MGSIKTSPQSINLLLVSLLFTPRFFSEAAYQTGTVLILIFWIVPFVLISEIAYEDWNVKSKLSELPKSTSSILLICLILIFASFYWREIIYADEINSYQNIKRSLYLLNPLILISWYPLIKIEQKGSFLIIFSILTIGLFSCLTIPIIFEITFISDYLNHLTAFLSGFISNIFLENEITVHKNYIIIDTTKIKVESGCSSIPQIMISLFGSLALYICCKIKSRITVLSYLIAAILIAFTINSVRISIISNLVLQDKIERFDFWHEGPGSMIFSFIVMLFTCALYYFLWTKENPIKNEKI